jgi:large subunit ribosomal protein L35
MKTRKSAAKRFKVTGSGKLMRQPGASAHLRECKSPKNKKKLSKLQAVHKTDAQKLKVMLPYMYYK